jgi:hypothetical protein
MFHILPLTLKLRLRLLVFCLLLLLAQFSLVACSEEGFSGETQPTIPDYPNAQNLQVTTVAREHPEPESQTVKLTTFSTQDKPDQVLAYYQQELKKNSWGVYGGPTPEANTGPTPEANTELFVWRQNTFTAASAFVLSITASESITDTNVKLELYEYLPD